MILLIARVRISKNIRRISQEYRNYRGVLVRCILSAYSIEVSNTRRYAPLGTVISRNDNWMTCEIAIALGSTRTVTRFSPRRKISLLAVEVGLLVDRLVCRLTGWYRCAGWQAGYAGSALSYLLSRSLLPHLPPPLLPIPTAVAVALISPASLISKFLLKLSLLRGRKS